MGQSNCGREISNFWEKKKKIEKDEILAEKRRCYVLISPKVEVSLQNDSPMVCMQLKPRLLSRELPIRMSRIWYTGIRLISHKSGQLLVKHRNQRNCVWILFRKCSVIFFTAIEYGKTRTCFFIAWCIVTKKRIRLAENKIHFDL